MQAAEVIFSKFHKPAIGVVKYGVAVITEKKCPWLKYVIFQVVSYHLFKYMHHDENETNIWYNVNVIQSKNIGDIGS